MPHQDVGTIGHNDRTYSLQEILSDRVEMEAGRTRVWGQFPSVPDEAVISRNNRGETVWIRFQPRMDIADALSPIAEKTDIVARQLGDNRVAVSIAEYGNTVQTTEYAEMVLKGSVRDETAEAVSENLVAVTDRIIMRAYIGAPLTIRANGAARTALDSTNDTLLNANVGLPFVGQAMSILRSNRAPGFESDGNGQQKYATVIHTGLAQDLRAAAGYLPKLQNDDGNNTIYTNEIGEFNGLRVMESAQGKMYPGAGQSAQAATTLSAAANAQATTITVASATGLSVGDFITIGTPETDDTDTQGIETVLITAVNGTTLTIMGTGYSSGNVATAALRYDHASGESVIEADAVGAMPIFGPLSAIMAHTAELGPTGEVRVSGPFDSLGRFVNVGWYHTFGVARTRGLWIVKLEVAAAYNSILINE